jgi:uncharacterized protein (TIGR02145 family)
MDKPEDYGNYYTFEEAQTVCPVGWRTPIQYEFKILTDANNGWTTLNAINGRWFGNDEQAIFLPAGGHYNFFHIFDKVYYQGSNGKYWSSTATNDNKGYTLSFVNSAVYPAGSYPCANGFSVRCVKDIDITSFPDGVTINGVTWATRNVGAKGRFVNNPEDYGNYYTFKEAQTACPTGWRTPTREEFKVLADANNGWTTVNGKTGRWFGNGKPEVFLPAAGSRSVSRGTLNSVDSKGYYWSDTPYSATYGYLLAFYAGTVNSGYYDYRDTGFAVRCVRK